MAESSLQLNISPLKRHWTLSPFVVVALGCQVLPWKTNNHPTKYKLFLDRWKKSPILDLQTHWCLWKLPSLTLPQKCPSIRSHIKVSNTWMCPLSKQAFTRQNPLGVKKPKHSARPFQFGQHDQMKESSSSSRPEIQNSNTIGSLKRRGFRITNRLDSSF